MMKRVLCISLLILVIVALPAAPSRADSFERQTYEYPIAYVGADNNIYVTGLNSTGAIQITNDADVYFQKTQREYRSRYKGPVWAPDGTKFAFVNPDGILYSVKSGERPVRIFPPTDDEVGLGWGFTSWSPDSKEIAFFAGGSDGGDALGIWNPSTGAYKNVLKFAYTGWAEVNGYTAADVVLEQEFDNQLATTRPYLQWTSAGILWGDKERSGPDARLTDLVTRDAQILRADIPFPVLSPDGKRALAKNKVFDFPFGEFKSVGIPDKMNGLAWTPDGKAILYAPGREPRFDVDSSRAVKEARAESRRAQLWLLPLEGGAPKLVFDQPGFDFARFATAESYPAVVFSYITIDPVYGARPEIVALRTSDPKAPPEWIAVGGQPSVSSKPFEAVGTRAAPSSNIKCVKSPPSRLVMGQRATASFEFMLTSSVYSATYLDEVKAGERVLVLKPPLCDQYGYSMWYIQAQNGRGWFPEGENDLYWLKP